MKRLWWLLAVVVVATAVKDVFDRFGPMAEAYRAYRERAAVEAATKKNDFRYRGIEGNVVEVTHRLESAEPAGDGKVRLVVVESIQFRRASEMGPLGNRRVASVRQHVVMVRTRGGWVVSELVEDEPEVTELGELYAR